MEGTRTRDQHTRVAFINARCTVGFAGTASAVRQPARQGQVFPSILLRSSPSAVLPYPARTLFPPYAAPRPTNPPPRPDAPGRSWKYPSPGERKRRAVPRRPRFLATAPRGWIFIPRLLILRANDRSCDTLPCFRALAAGNFLPFNSTVLKTSSSDLLQSTRRIAMA